MTTTTTAAYSGPYEAAGQTAFAVDFQSAGETEIEVVLDGEVIDADEWTFDRDEDGTGEVTVPAGLTGTVYIRSAPSFAQSVDFQRHGPWFPDMLNAPLDAAARRDIWLKDQISRALIVPTGEAGPVFNGAANRLLGTNSMGVLAMLDPEYFTLPPISELLYGIYRPETYGAAGDGVTDDSAAFAEMSAAINAAGGGTIHLQPGVTYIVSPTLPGAGGYYIQGGAAIDIDGVDFIAIRMNGATIKFADGLKFGSFDPVTGLSYAPVLPFYNYAYRAEPGRGIRVQNSGKVRVYEGFVNCNSTKLNVGGEWGETGRQIVHYGVAIETCEDVVVDGVRVVNSALDCFVYAYTGLTESSDKRPARFMNCRGDRAARNCMSIVGGNQVLLMNTNLVRAGEAPNDGFGNISSNPKSCLDIEAEDAQVRDFHMLGGSLMAGAYTSKAVVSDSGDSADGIFDGVLIIGDVFINNPRFHFTNRTRVFGGFSSVYGEGIGDPDNTTFDNCILTDAPFGTETPYAPAYFMTTVTAQGARITNSEIILTRTYGDFQYAVMRNVNITIRTNTTRRANQQTILQFGNADLNKVRITEDITTSAPADAYYIVGPTTYRDIELVSPNNKVFWDNWSTGAGGHKGRYAEKSQTYDIAALAARGTAGDSLNEAFALPGLRATDRIRVELVGNVAGCQATAWYSADNLCVVTFSNPTAAGIDPASTTIHLKAVKPGEGL